MPHNILITGASGYLGGTLLARMTDGNAVRRLPQYGKLYALVRTDAQAEAVRRLYGAEPLRFDNADAAAARAAVVGARITVVYHLTDGVACGPQMNFIEALAEVRRTTGSEVHFLATTGAKVFSSHAGARTDAPLLDNDPDLHAIHKAQKAPFPVMQQAVETNWKIVERAEALGVRSYIFAPCIVYGKGEGFGNQISIQTVAIVRAAQATRRVYRTDEGRPTWPVCHVLDNTSLYLDLLRKMLTGEDIGYGRRGYYLASSGSVAWDDLYDAMAAGLARRGVVDDAAIATADDAALERMAPALGCPKELVTVMVGGRCTFTAEHGREIGWKPAYGPGHILEAADAEVELILQKS